MLLVPLMALEAKLCEKDLSKTECSKILINYPLFDTPYKLLANYVPILPLRALAHGNIYKEKKSFKLERYYYLANASESFKDPYAKLIGEGKVKGVGFFGRKISFDGMLNDFKLTYINKVTPSLPRRAKMKVSATVDDVTFLDLVIKSDGDEMTNDVEGSFFGKDVQYHTYWRDTEGLVAGHKYKIHTEGKVKEEAKFAADTKGTIGEYDINGSINMTAPGKYFSSEHYGPILVKTYVTIL